MYKKNFTESLLKMSTELVEVGPHEINRAMSLDSEYDDALEVPDSLEIRIDENGETIQVYKQESMDSTACTDSRGMNLYTLSHHAHFLMTSVSF